MPAPPAFAFLNFAGQVFDFRFNTVELTAEDFAEIYALGAPLPNPNSDEYPNDSVRSTVRSAVCLFGSLLLPTN